MMRRWGDLVAFYFFYFVFLGVLIPYAGLWLHDRGMSAVQIGLIMGTFIGTKIVAPTLWGWLSDRTGRKVRWMRLAAASNVLFLSGWLLAHSFAALLLSTAAFSFFYHAMLPQGEAITLSRLPDKRRYGRIRLWGSVGFILAVLAAGFILRYGGVLLLPVMLFGAAAFLWIAVLQVREGPSQTAPALGSELDAAGFGALLRQPAVQALLMATFLVTASHGVYYNFYSLALAEAGYDESLISLLWSWAVLVEVGLFFFMHRLFHVVAVPALFRLAIGLTALRWGLNMLWPTQLGVQLFAQALHAASYALFHGAAMMMIDRFFPPPYQVRGQGLYAAISHGLGGGIGAVLAGYLWHWGGGALGYGVSVGMALLALMIFYYGYGRSES